MSDENGMKLDFENDTSMEVGEFRQRLEDFDGTLLIGVSGDSGSGKSTFTRGIRNLLGKDLVSTITLDSYHTEDRETRKKTGHLPLDPAINRLSLAAEHFAALRKGETIMKPNYNHKTGKFDDPTEFTPTKIVILEGLHTMYLPEMRRNLDFTIYVDPARTVKWDWKIRRDVEKRGYDRADVMREILLREPLYKQYIDFQKVFAEIVIKIDQSKFKDADTDVYSVRLIQRITDIPLSGINMSFDLGAMMRKSRKPFSFEYRGDYYYGKPVVEMTIDGQIHRNAVEELESRIRKHTGFSENPLLDRERETINATLLSQLLVSWRFAEKMNAMLKEIERAEKRVGL